MLTLTITISTMDNVNYDNGILSIMSNVSSTSMLLSSRSMRKNTNNFYFMASNIA